MLLELITATLVCQLCMWQEDRPKDKPAHPAVAAVISPIENDRRIARWLIGDVRGMIDCSQLLMERSSNETVKQFAQKIINEHKDCLAQLERYKNTSDPASPGRGNAPVSRLENTTIDPAKSAVLAKDEGGQQRDGKIIYRAADFLEVKEDVCEKMRDLMMKEFKQIPASEVDAVFLKHAVMCHEAMIASCNAVTPCASSELRSYLTQGTTKMKDHLNEVRKLSSQLVTAK